MTVSNPNSKPQTPGPHTPDPHTPTPHSRRPTPYSLLPTPNPYLILTLLLSLFAIGPLMQPGYFWGAHDARSSVYFLFEFNKSIGDGILWPRWGPDWGFGYGYPFWNIYGPLAYFVGEGVYLLGFDYIPAVKIVFALSVLGSAAAMYLFVRRLLGRPAGLVAGLVYVYVPYHLFDLYVRAALSESFGFIFIPLVFWGFFELVDRPRLNAFIGTGLAYAGLMLTSNLLGLLLTPTLGLFVAILMLLRLRDEKLAAGSKKLATAFKRLIRLGIPPALGLGLGIGLSAIFVLPALLEYRYVRVDQWTGGRYAFGSDFVYFFQLFSPRWGFGASIPGPDDQAGFQLGLVPVVLFVLSFFAVPHIPEANTRRVLRFFQGMVLVVAFLMTPASKWIWRTIPLSSFAQFPWRLGVLTTTGLAVVAGAVVAGSQGIRTQGIRESGNQGIRNQGIRESGIRESGIGESGRRESGLGDSGIRDSADQEIRESGHRDSGYQGTQTQDWAPDSPSPDSPSPDSLIPDSPSPDSPIPDSPIPDSPSPDSPPPPTLPLIILTALIILGSYPYLRAEVREPKPNEGPVSLAALFRYQQSSDEMTGSTAWTQRIPGWSVLAEQVVQGGSIKTKVDYTAIPPGNVLGVHSMEMDSVHELVWVYAADDQQSVTFFIPYYPGWTAYIYEDLGQPIEPLKARVGPLVAKPPMHTTEYEGWLVVPVPQGEHFLEVRFEDTPVRVVGKWVSLASLLGVIVAVVGRRFLQRFGLR
jgi:hypothetical protein